MTESSMALPEYYARQDKRFTWDYLDCGIGELTVLPGEHESPCEIERKDMLPVYWPDGTQTHMGLGTAKATFERYELIDLPYGMKPDITVWKRVA
jgi:hypothetical protein